MKENYVVQIMTRGGSPFQIVSTGNGMAEALANARRQYPSPEYVVMSARKAN